MGTHMRYRNNGIQAEVLWESGQKLAGIMFFGFGVKVTEKTTKSATK